MLSLERDLCSSVSISTLFETSATGTSLHCTVTNLESLITLDGGKCMPLSGILHYLCPMLGAVLRVSKSGSLFHVSSRTSVNRAVCPLRLSHKRWQLRHLNRASRSNDRTRFLASHSLSQNQSLKTVLCQWVVRLASASKEASWRSNYTAVSNLQGSIQAAAWEMFSHSFPSQTSTACHCGVNYPLSFKTEAQGVKTAGESRDRGYWV